MDEGGRGEGGRGERGGDVGAWDVERGSVGCGRLGFDSWEMGLKRGGGGDLYMRCRQGRCTCRRGFFANGEKNQVSTKIPTV